MYGDGCAGLCDRMLVTLVEPGADTLMCESGPAASGRVQPALSGAGPAGPGPAASADSGGKRSIRIKLGVSKLTGSQVPAHSRSLAQPSGDIDGAACLRETVAEQ